MGQSTDAVEKAYDMVAQEYAAAFSGEHAMKPKDQEIFRRFALMMGDRGPVWDLGCGPGHTAQALHALGIHISGLDLSENMLRQARALHPALHFQKGNILDLEFANDSIAGVVSFYAIVHFTEEQLERAFREVFRVLQPGGVFLFTFHIGDTTLHINTFLGKTIAVDFMLFPTDRILRVLKHSGFTNKELIEREPYPDVEHQSRRAYVFAIKPVTR